MSKTDASGTTTYSWDYENRLTSVTLPNQSVVTFKYDPIGRRIQKSSTTGTINYVYDGADGVEEVDSTGAVLARYAMGPGIDQPLSILRSGTTSYYETDGLGSVTSLTDGAGSAVGSYVFDSFGKLTSPEGGVTNAFRYTAREFDSEIGLYYYRARYYDPTSARFLSEDPMRFAAGANFYGYVNGNPVNLIDPMGLCGESDTQDACHAQLSVRYGDGGKIFGQQHLWWWISIGTQDWIISGTGVPSVPPLYLNTYVTPGTQSSSNPDDKVGNGRVVFDTRDAHGGFASPEDCAKVRLMLSRAQYLESLNYTFTYSGLGEQTSNTPAYYVGWPYVGQVHPPSNVWGWGARLPETMNGVYTGISYPKP